MFEYHTLNDLIKLSADNNLEIWEIIQQADMYENDRSESDSFNMMKEMYVAMKNADSMYDGTLRSASNKAGCFIHTMNPAKISVVLLWER